MSKNAYLFPGQGSQYAGMGKDLFERYPSAKAIFDTADRVLEFPFSDLIFHGDSEELKQTVNAQPALLTMSIACLEAAKEAGILPNAEFTAGHSLGEYSALVAAGALSFETALKLSRERGRLMYEAGLKAPGTMAAVIALDYEAVKAVCEETGAYIANLNCPGQIVISGSPDAITAARKAAKEKGAKLVLPLQVSGAFHSPMIQSAAEGLAPQIRDADIQNPQIPVIGNTAAQVITDAAAVRQELTDQVCSCVRWEESVRTMLEQGVDTFYEIGPGNVLKGLLARIAPEAKCICLGKAEDMEA